MSTDSLPLPTSKRRTAATVLRDVVLCVLVLPALCVGACFVGPLALAATLETRYAPGYSQEKFHAVAMGQSRDEVLARLGEPLRKSSHSSTESWSYSESPHDTHYWCRVVIFDATGHVERVHSELYVD